MRKLRLIITLATIAVSGVASAQCTFRNDAFLPGEFLSYNLYYNWKFVWVKAGSASMYVVKSTYDGRQAYRASLTTRGSDEADNFFVMCDTLLSYTSMDMAPLYYRKGAREGGRYTVDEVRYSYPNGNCAVSMSRQHTDGHTDRKHAIYEGCVYDMMSIFLRARSFKPETWKKGASVKFPIMDGNGRIPAEIKYLGKVVVRADNGRKYRCLRLSYTETERGKTKEIARFFVTDDKNHVPVRLDMFLKFGSAKAFLTNMKGTRNPITSTVR